MVVVVVVEFIMKIMELILPITSAKIKAMMFFINMAKMVVLRKRSC